MDAGGKRCNCEKSKCLKLVCRCFVARVYCADRCGCKDCFNNPGYKNVVEEVRKKIELRNPMAFAHQGDGNLNNTSSAEQKGGCNCKNSKCLFRSCVCHRDKVGCTVNCCCGNCYNSFGKKPGAENLSQLRKESGKKETNPVKIDDIKCNCKGTKCWKLSCKCVAAGTSCKDCCTCEDCRNKPKAHPIAEPPTDSQHTISNGNSVSTSQAGHKRKCKCKKAKCVMDLCNCYQAKVGCSNVCLCKDCHNPFGKKSEYGMLQTAENWKNQSKEMPNMGEVMSNSIKVGTANISRDCQDVTMAESDSGTNSLQYSSDLCPKQMCPSKEPQEIQSFDDVLEWLRHDPRLDEAMNSIDSMKHNLDNADLINDVDIGDSDLTDKMESGSPNQDQ